MRILPPPAMFLLPPPPPAGQLFSGEDRWVLVLRVPPFLGHSEHLQWGQEVSALASQLPGWNATEPGWRAQGETEAPLSLLPGLWGSIATLRTRDISPHVCPGSGYPAHCPAPSPCHLTPLASYPRLGATSQGPLCPSPPDPQCFLVRCRVWGAGLLGGLPGGKGLALQPGEYFVGPLSHQQSQRVCK